MTPDFGKIIGHGKQLNYLKKIIENGTVNHAYCFSGPAQLGKYTIARHFVAAILEVDVNRLEIHPNVSIISSEENISVEQIRELRERLTLSTIGGGKKAAIIDNAHQMTLAAQSALLKTLEEPSGNALIVLVTEHPERLLLTIRSRSAHLRFDLVPTENIKGEMSELAAGRPGLAIRLSDPDYKNDFLQNKKEAEDFLKMSLAGRFTYIESVVKQKEERNDKIKELIQIWRVLIHRKLLQSLGVNYSSSGRDPKSYATALCALSETEAALNANSNKSLALQHFALSF